jgi:predicted O-methyltransferase YrrM
MYINPQIESSYQENDLGKTIYDLVLELKPKNVVEFGCLYGYSTVAIGMALKHLGEGKLISYDLFEKYPYKYSPKSITQQNLEKYGVEDYVELKEMDYNQWLNNPTEFDLLHLDISNTGDTILNTSQLLNTQIQNGSVVLFEGGSIERDNIEWVVKYGSTPINAVKKFTSYTIINENFPSLSIIKNL